MKIRSFLFLIFIISQSLFSRQILANIGEIPKQELQNVIKNRFVFHKKDVKDSKWPVITIYALIDASPLESIAIYAAYDHQKNYVPNVLKSEVYKHIGPTDVQTSYLLDIPWPLANSHYINGAIIKKNNAENYTLDWYQVESDSLEDTNGHVAFTTYRGKTLMSYTNKSKPKGFIAALAKDIMIKDVQSTIKKIIKYIENNKGQTKLMNRYKSKITKAFANEYVYIEEIKKNRFK
jgi:hypothetical protein